VLLGSATVASVLSTVLTAVDAVGHDGGGSDDGGGTGNRGSDDSSSGAACGS
jgi:hypothetical protein